MTIHSPEFDLIVNASIAHKLSTLYRFDPDSNSWLATLVVKDNAGKVVASLSINSQRRAALWAIGSRIPREFDRLLQQLKPKKITYRNDAWGNRRAA